MGAMLPELGQALGGPPGGAPSEIDIPAEGGPPPGGGGSSIDFLDDAEAALQEFIRVDPDEPDRAKASQALKIVLDLKALNQKSNDAGDMKSLRRALSNGGAAGAGGVAPGG